MEAYPLISLTSVVKNDNNKLVEQIEVSIANTTKLAYAFSKIYPAKLYVDVLSVFLLWGRTFTIFIPSKSDNFKQITNVVCLKEATFSGYHLRD